MRRTVKGKTGYTVDITEPVAIEHQVYVDGEFIGIARRTKYGHSWEIRDTDGKLLRDHRYQVITRYYPSFGDGFMAVEALIELHVTGEIDFGPVYDRT